MKAYSLNLLDVLRVIIWGFQSKSCLNMGWMRCYGLCQAGSLGLIPFGMTFVYAGTLADDGNLCAGNMVTALQVADIS